MDLSYFISSLISMKGSNMFFFHSDISRVMGVIPRKRDMKLWLNDHIDFLNKEFSNGSFIFPSFNYDFLKSGIYDLNESESQVGALSEHFRLHRSCWRSEVPVFNVTGNNGSLFLENSLKVLPNGVVDPFDESSIFHKMYDENCLVVMYGADFSSFTGIHHIESLAGNPLYRYDKLFSGKVVGDGHKDVTLKYHVRPMGIGLAYRWDFLLDLCVRSGIVHCYNGLSSNLIIFSYKGMVDFLLPKVIEDPLFLIDDESRSKCAELLDKLGRRFLQSDFES